MSSHVACEMSFPPAELMCPRFVLLFISMKHTGRESVCLSRPVSLRAHQHQRKSSAAVSHQGHQHLIIRVLSPTAAGNNRTLENITVSKQAFISRFIRKNTTGKMMKASFPLTVSVCINPLHDIAVRIITIQQSDQ